MGRFVNPDSSAFQVALNSRIIQWFLAKCDDADKVVPFITKSVLMSFVIVIQRCCHMMKGGLLWKKILQKRGISRFLYLVF